jgi:hypothetical protein
VSQVSTQQTESAVRKELSERLDWIERLAETLADDHCDFCDGEGIEYEGDEWSICKCVVKHLH